MASRASHTVKSHLVKPYFLNGVIFAGQCYQRQSSK